MKKTPVIVLIVLVLFVLVIAITLNYSKSSVYTNSIKEENATETEVVDK